MSAYYLDGGVNTAVQEFSIPTIPSGSGTHVVIQTSNGYVSRLRMARFVVNFAAVNGERGVWLRYLDPDGVVLGEALGGFDYWGGPTFKPPSQVDLNFALNTGTPTFSNASDPANIATVAVVILPDIWLPESFQIAVFAQNLQAGDNIEAVSGMLELREPGSAAGLPSEAFLSKTPFLLPTVKGGSS